LLQARVFTSVSLFDPSLTFEGKIGAYPSGATCGTAFERYTPSLNNIIG